MTRWKRVDRGGARGHVVLRVHRAEDIRRQIPDWKDLSRKDKLVALRKVAPLHEQEVTNLTTEGWARHWVDKFMGQAVPDVSHYAVGSGTTAPKITDTDLATRQNTQPITLLQDAGLTLETSTFWDTTEINGVTVAEGGILAGGTPGTPGSGGVLLARVLFDPAQTKDSSKTFTIDHDHTGVPK